MSIRVASVLIGVAMLAGVVILWRSHPQPAPQLAASTEARVLRVIDGDTVDVCCPPARVRLLGIDAPERGEPLYEEAGALVRRLTQGHIVRLERCREDADRYGRLLRHLFVGQRHVNVELVSAGLARSYIFSLRRNPCYADDLLAAEGIAQKQRLGLWARGF